MNSLPLISHRLFAAAIGQPSEAEARHANFEAQPCDPVGPAKHIPLELLETVRDWPALRDARRLLRASVSGDGI
jgi:hypothetical protein